MASTFVWALPQYTTAEAAADRVIHLLALAIAIGASGWLLLTAAPSASPRQAAALSVYSLGLIGMLSASAAYNLSPPCRRKDLLRRVDRAMIFVMIAGTYTPFAVSGLRNMGGLLLCMAVWSLAAIGAVVTLAWPRRFERLLLVLYLVMGWIGLVMGHKFLRHFPTPVLLLLLAGGAAYSVGALIYSRRRFPFQNAVWHALVVFAAGLHWAAIAQLPQ